ncbi:hypothetical protein LSH36_2g06026 [Paralvinella palmiformis]|uniref:Uncharacterized protein n=1 Tax=Paralvinella palmiformis TaxID=53620 RepID=A0AAD9KFS2_9ANNE|nr:hypothetical protein LSH36_2g06026 [Paralvinella palmiformis]
MPRQGARSAANGVTSLPDGRRQRIRRNACAEDAQKVKEIRLTSCFQKAMAIIDTIRTSQVDLWMMMGMVFVFAALIEYAILNSLERHAKQKTQKPGDYKIDEETPEKKKPRKDPSDRVDEVSRIIFPLAFIIFNLVYWPYYTSGR